MSDEPERVSITVPRQLIAEFDDAIEEWEYASRSEAVRAALREFLSARYWEDDPGRTFQGSIQILYDHDVATEELLEAQHAATGTIIATQHVHFDEHLCLESLIVEGSGEELRELANSLRAIEGVKQVRTAAM